MAIEDYYTTLTRLEMTETDNGRGGKLQAWASAGTFQGLINQLSSGEIDANMKIDIEADHKLYCSTNEAITSASRVQDGAKRYRVVSEPKNTVRRDHHYKILLKRVGDE